MFPFAWLTSSLFRVMSKPGSWFYAVKNGRVPGVYRTWSECESQVKGFSKPAFKKFASLQEAQQFISEKDFSFDEAARSSYFPASGSAGSFQPQTSNLDTSTGQSGAVSLASLSATVADMQKTVSRLVNVMEALSSDMCQVQDRVARLEAAIFIAPGAKRNFSTMAAAGSDGAQDGKRPKKEKSGVGGFTGPAFAEEDGVSVYTDGGCFDNGRNGARAGIGVFWKTNDPDNVGEPLSGRPSNNRAEIHAAVRAVQIAKRRGIQNLTIHTDSHFLINGITKWIKGWKKNGWKLSTGHPVVNKDDFTALDNELSEISVKWVYVKGHSGDPGNEEADKLAKQGAAMNEQTS